MPSNRLNGFVNLLSGRASWLGLEKMVEFSCSVKPPLDDGGLVNTDIESTTPDFRMQNIKTKPIHEVRLGSIKAAVWRNDTDSGVRYNATFSRLYKDGDQWKSTESFGRDDLLLLAKVADHTHSWILSQSQEVDSTTKAAGPTRG
jgi:hypothetical protein